MIRLVPFLVPLSSLFALAQPSSDYLYPVRQGRKFGFINRSGKVVAPQCGNSSPAADSFATRQRPRPSLGG